MPSVPSPSAPYEKICASSANVENSSGIVYTYLPQQGNGGGLTSLRACHMNNVMRHRIKIGGISRLTLFSDIGRRQDRCFVIVPSDLIVSST